MAPLHASVGLTLVKQLFAVCGSSAQSDACVQVLRGCVMLLFVHGWLCTHCALPDCRLYVLPATASSVGEAHVCVHHACVELCERKQSANEAVLPP